MHIGTGEAGAKVGHVPDCDKDMFLEIQNAANDCRTYFYTHWGTMSINIQKQIHYLLYKDMNFEENPGSMTHIHLRPVFQSPWYLGPTIIFYAALIGVGIIVNCVIAGKDFMIKCFFWDTGEKS